MNYFNQSNEVRRFLITSIYSIFLSNLTARAETLQLPPESNSQSEFSKLLESVETLKNVISKQQGEIQLIKQALNPTILRNTFRDFRPMNNLPQVPADKEWRVLARLFLSEGLWDVGGNHVFCGKGSSPYTYGPVRLEAAISVGLGGFKGGDKGSQSIAGAIMSTCSGNFAPTIRVKIEAPGNYVELSGIVFGASGIGWGVTSDDSYIEARRIPSL